MKLRLLLTLIGIILLATPAWADSQPREWSDVSVLKGLKADKPWADDALVRGLDNYYNWASARLLSGLDKQTDWSIRIIHFGLDNDKEWAYHHLYDGLEAEEKWAVKVFEDGLNREGAPTIWAQDILDNGLYPDSEKEVSAKELIELINSSNKQTNSAKISMARVDPRLNISAFVGGASISPFHDLYDHRLSIQRRFKPGAANFGFRAGYLVEIVGAEAEFGFTPTATMDGQSAFLYGIRGHVMGQIPWRHLKPFIVVGGGVLGVSSNETTAVGNATEGTFHWGGGLKIKVWQYGSIRLDFRHLIGKRVTGGNASHVSLSLGFNFLVPGT